MNVKFIQSGSKKKLIKELDGQFGIKRVPYLLFETGKSKIRGFSGTMNRDEVQVLSEIANVEFLGLYLFKKEGQIRLSLDGSNVFGKVVEKRLFELNEEQVNDWFHGENLEVELERGIHVLKFGNDFLGCGISDGKKLMNYMPKERRIRNS